MAEVVAVDGNTTKRSDAGPKRFVSQLTRDTFALVLAGGRGSRLFELTDLRAKPAVPFGGKFRVIDFALSNCVNSGIRRIGVVTQYKAQSLIRHLQRGWSFLDGRFDEFIELMPAQQQIAEEWYRGTADAVFQNLAIVRRNLPKYLLVLAGDQVYKMDYGRMIAFHRQSEADVTVACVEVPLADAGAFGIMGVDANDRVESFTEKSANPQSVPGRPDQALASMGVYVFNAEFLYEQLIRDADEPRSHHDFGHNIIPYVVPRYRVFAHRFADSCVGMDEGRQAYWRDVGTIDASTGKPTWNSPRWCRNSICTTRNGRSGPTTNWRRRRNSCLMTTTGAGWRSIRWCRGAVSSAARQCAARCCSPTCGLREAP
jgi:glucose-1-phosphate adenylyltransferase